MFVSWTEYYLEASVDSLTNTMNNILMYKVSQA